MLYAKLTNSSISITVFHTYLYNFNITLSRLRHCEKKYFDILKYPRILFR